MREPARITIKSIMSDIHSDTAASDIMKKYGLSPKGLETVFRQLVSAGLLNARQLAERYPNYASLLSAKTADKGAALTLSVPVPIHDLESSARGILRNISADAIRVVGVRARVGETKTFQIPVDMFMAAAPLQLSARCVWVQTNGEDRKNIVACFEVVKLTKSQREVLDRFIRVMFLSSSGEWQVANP